MSILGEFEQLILWAVLRLGADAYGVRIAEEIERRTERDVSPGAIYTALGRLEDRGLVSSHAGAGDQKRAGRPRKYYELRPSAVEALEASYSRLAAMAEGQVERLRQMQRAVEP